MPTYDFKCPKCNFSFESWLSQLVPGVTDKDTTNCKKCKAVLTRENIINKFKPCTNFSFKGGAPSEAATTDQDKLIDKLVGRAAEVGKEYQEKRAKNKREAQRKYGDKFLTRVGDEYIPSSKEAKEATKEQIPNYIKIADEVKKGNLKLDNKGRLHL